PAKGLDPGVFANYSWPRPGTAAGPLVSLVVNSPGFRAAARRASAAVTNGRRSPVGTLGNTGRTGVPVAGGGIRAYWGLALTDRDYPGASSGSPSNKVVTCVWLRGVTGTAARML